MCVLVARLCLTLWDLMNCSPLGSSVHGISQARILEWLPFLPLGDLPDPGIFVNVYIIIYLLWYIYLQFCWCTFQMFLPLAIVNNAAINMYIYIFVWVLAFNWAWDINLESELLSHMVIYACLSDKFCHSSSTMSHFHQQCTKVPLPPHSHQHLPSSGFWSFDNSSS